MLDGELNSKDFRKVEGLCTCIVAHDDARFFARTIKNYLRISPVYVVVSRTGWDGKIGNWERVRDVAEKAGATVILVDVPTESTHRSYSCQKMRKLGFRLCITADADELPDDKLLRSLLAIAESGVWDRVAVTMDTYFASTDLVVRPREQLTPILLINLETVRHKHIRDYEGGSLVVLGPDAGILHHASYVPGEAGDPADIERKIATSTHAPEIADTWYEKVFLPEFQKHDPFARNLHSTHPGAYYMLERISQPSVFAGFPLPIIVDTEELGPVGKISFIIPLYGGCEDIRACLKSLKEELAGLDIEIIVVDDRSPDRAAKVAESFEGVKVIRNKKNIGFGGTCNVGYRASTGEIIVFLNSDTIVTRCGILRLIQSLMSSPLIGAAGPITNNASQFQQVEVSYTSLETMPLFSKDVAALEGVEDEFTDMLVGFCLATKRQVLEDVGLWDERFTTGQFEDNDLCYRMRRKGYLLAIAKRAFLYHAGSHSLNRRKEHPALLLARNQRLYLEKWAEDLECGFASHLSGLSPEPIVFHPLQKPEEIDKRIQKLAKKAGICLCMIVKNEAKNLPNCLRSVMNGVVQAVIVDTGSQDATVEIAKSFGAQTYIIIWPDSFSIARNKSLIHSRQKWIMFLDADDTLDKASLERILLAVTHAPDKVGGFVIPVRFVDQGPYGGTQVDHIHVFRCLPGIEFEGRIHEQILQSIRNHGLEVVRIPDAVIRHSGYDLSFEGQAIKRALHKTLLVMDHEDEPRNPFRMFNIAMEAHPAGEFEETIHWAKMAINHANPEASIVRKCYSFWGTSVRALGDVEESLNIFAKGLKVAPDDPELTFETARSLTEIGKLAEAKDWYLKVNPDTSGHFSSIDTGILTYKRFFNLAGLCMALNQYGEARHWWLEALKAAPDFSPAAEALFEAAMTVGDLRTAKDALDLLQRAQGPTENWAMRFCSYSLAAGNLPEFAIRNVLKSMPYAVGPLLVLARMLQERGDDAQLLPLAVELDRLGVAEGAFMRAMVSLRAMDLWGALEHIGRTLELNPMSDAAEKHLSELRRILASEALPYEATGQDVLFGPHVGNLGPSSCPHSVVVVTYNSARTILDCAERVLSSMGLTDELIIVDNASSDGTQFLLSEIAEGDSRVKLILQEENLGYSPAANIGLLASHGAFLTTLNPDAFVNEGWTEAMSALLTDGVAAVGPVSDRVGGDQFVGHYLDGRRPELDELGGVMRSDFDGRSEETKLLVGICVMYRRETLDKYGLLEERCKLGADDLEYSWRMRMFGLTLKVSVGTFVRHEHGVSFSSLPSPLRLKLQGQSDAGCVRKMQAYHGTEDVPDSIDMFDDPILQDALDRIRLLGYQPCLVS